MAPGAGRVPGYVPKILALAGSTRADSFNKKLVHIAIKGAQQAAIESLGKVLAQFLKKLKG